MDLKFVSEVRSLKLHTIYVILVAHNLNQYFILINKNHFFVRYDKKVGNNNFRAYIIVFCHYNQAVEKHVGTSKTFIDRAKHLIESMSQICS